MKKLLLLGIVLMGLGAIAQTTTDYAIRVSATVNKAAPSITLNWETNDNTTSQYFVFRKLKGATSWGTPVAQIASTTKTYTDNSVTVGNSYEYRVYKSSSNNPTGYIYAGIEEPAIHDRGAILVLIDSTFTDSCKNEITTLLEDLRGDGWEVVRKDVSRNADVQAIKALVVSEAQSNSTLTALFIIGHVAIPHSGDINPDAHANHKGAWPADTYYGDIDGNWTDNTVSNTSSANNKNHNTPGDGNLDQSIIPSDIDLQVGRIDFYNMPAFGKSEVTMMKSYLDKAHNYKAGNLTIVKQALIDDNFKSYAEGFAANGWRNFSPMVGINNVSEKDFISTLDATFHQWAYGCGGGTYTSAGGIGNTTNIVGKNMKTIFTMLFGSYFGDWDYKDNFLRAPLCADDPALACIWAGRPNYYLHHMALGENIGYSVHMSQNNSSTYDPVGYGGRWVHTALLGDPTLRVDYFKPAANLQLTATTANGAELSWSASPEANVAGYNIYRSEDEFGKYELRAEMINGTSFNDTAGKDGDYWYMVRAVKLEQTPSGSYFNMSLGTQPAFGSIDYPYFPVNTNKVVRSINKIVLYPNPAKNVFHLNINTDRAARGMITAYDMSGKTMLIKSASLHIGSNIIDINCEHLVPGNYLLQINTDVNKKVLSFTVAN